MLESLERQTKRNDAVSLMLFSFVSAEKESKKKNVTKRRRYRTKISSRCHAATKDK
jgi:hypothetical protein